MAITRIQAAGSGHGGSGGFGAQAATFSSNVTAGSLLVCLWWGNSNVGNATCADNVNGAWTALTQRTPVAGSGRRMNWFYKLASASGAITVTVTPSANAGNSEWMQIVEYSGVAGYDSAVAAYAAHASGTPATITSGTPTQSGDLVLMGFVSDTESNKTFTANSPLTAIALNGTQTGGQNNGSATLAIGELLSAGSGTVAGSMGIGVSDAGGKYIIGFSPTTSSNLTKTQTATARIATNLTKTQPATARIAIAKTKTQPATARIANIRTLTQTAVARINVAGAFTKTQTATARIAQTRTLTQTAVARISVVAVLTKTQPATARIAIRGTKTQTAVARVARNQTLTQTARANIGQSGTKTQTAIARISRSYIKTQPATARISVQGTKTQTAKARIAVRVYRFEPPVLIDVPRTLAKPSPHDRFWSRIKRGPVGLTVLKDYDGNYTSVQTPTQVEKEAAAIAYTGGHVYYVTATEAAALTAAGYTVMESVI